MNQGHLLDRSHVNTIHLVGIGGIGLSAIARVLLADGYRITGSDMRTTPLTAELQAAGMTIYQGHAAANVNGADLVIVSSAVPRDNPELVAARERGIPVAKRDHILGEMLAQRVGVAVAGTHGKTTTSAMIAFCLDRLGLDPTFVVGGILQNLHTNARRGGGPHFVLEADEYDNTFLGLQPQVAVITSIEMDHPDCFKDMAAVEAAFYQFACRVPATGTVIGCMDAPPVAQLLRRLAERGGLQVVTYGLDSPAQWQARDMMANEASGSSFAVWHDGRALGATSLQLPGRHNVANALAGIAVLHRLGVDVAQALAVLPEYRGTGRRFEVKGEARGVTVIDDYAHHPTQIQATLAAVRARYGRRPVWAYFQPHTYSRTKELLDEYACSFAQADHVLISEIYAAREKDSLGISARDLVQRMRHPDVEYAPDVSAAGVRLAARVQPGDVVITLGAGDGHLVGEHVLRSLAQESREND